MNNLSNIIDEDFKESCKVWFSQEINNLTEKLSLMTPSEWAENNRYLPASVSPLPGFYNYNITPPLKEIVDCLDIRSTVREITLMKGAQIGATVGVLENAIGYFISEVRSSPMMLLTADAELAKIRMESHITVMVQQSGLADLIQTTDELSRNKTGKTASKLEWFGGGYLLPFGARNAAKLRSSPIQILLEDEVDGYPENVGKDGDPMKLAEGRTKAYSQTRKILRLSTPLIKGASRIERSYLDGDQRKFLVPCKKCNRLQELRFQGVDELTGLKWGLIWKTDASGILIPDSVRYLCKFCNHPHVNADKSWMLPRGKWQITGKPKSPYIRSYHLSGLYSPASMFSWADMVRDYLSAWDDKENKVKDLRLYQEFYNNALGESFELRGSKLKFSTVSGHRRSIYKYGEIPNKYAMLHSESSILVLTCAVDIHKDNLCVAIFGWTRGNRTYLIDYFKLYGDPTQEDDPGTWMKLSDLILEKEYIADDESKYRIILTLIDSGYLQDQVLQFCDKFESGVYPIKGRDETPKNAAIKEFSEFTTKFGMNAYGITTTLYKDRMSAVLKRRWSGTGIQRERTFNVPLDITDEELKELTVEQKRERINKITKQVDGYEWYRPSGAKNELWDLLIYNAAAIDLIAWDVCKKQLELDHVNWLTFWDYVESEKLFFDPKS